MQVLRDGGFKLGRLPLDLAADQGGGAFEQGAVGNAAAGGTQGLAQEVGEGPTCGAATLVLLGLLVVAAGGQQYVPPGSVPARGAGRQVTG